MAEASLITKKSSIHHVPLRTTHILLGVTRVTAIDNSGHTHTLKSTLKSWQQLSRINTSSGAKALEAGLASGTKTQPIILYVTRSCRLSSQVSLRDLSGKRHLTFTARFPWFSFQIAAALRNAAPAEWISSLMFGLHFERTCQGITYASDTC